MMCELSISSNISVENSVKTSLPSKLGKTYSLFQNKYFHEILYSKSYFFLRQRFASE